MLRQAVVIVIVAVLAAVGTSVFLRPGVHVAARDIELGTALNLAEALDRSVSHVAPQDVRRRPLGVDPRPAEVPDPRPASDPGLVLTCPDILSAEEAKGLLRRRPLGSAEYYSGQLGLGLDTAALEALQGTIDSINGRLRPRLDAVHTALSSSMDVRASAGDYRVLLPGEFGPARGEAVGGFATVQHDGATNERRLIVIWPGEFADVDVAADELTSAYHASYAALREAIGLH